MIYIVRTFENIVFVAAILTSFITKPKVKLLFATWKITLFLKYYSNRHTSAKLNTLKYMYRLAPKFTSVNLILNLSPYNTIKNPALFSGPWDCTLGMWGLPESDWKADLL